MTKTEPTIGEYIAAAWKGHGRNQTVDVSPSFQDITSVRAWLRKNRFSRYVIKQKADKPGGGSDGFKYLERTV